MDSTIDIAEKLYDNYPEYKVEASFFLSAAYGFKEDCMLMKSGKAGEKLPQRERPPLTTWKSVKAKITSVPNCFSVTPSIITFLFGFLKTTPP